MDPVKKFFQKECFFHQRDRRYDEILLHRFQLDTNYLIEKSLTSTERNIFTIYFIQKIIIPMIKPSICMSL